MRSVTLHDEAKLEIGEAARWYDMREPGVCDDLWQCVEVALDMLESGQIIPGRRCRAVLPSMASGAC